jgi:hypothetical protein
MKTKRFFYFVLTFSFCFVHQAFAQPYLYTNGTDKSNFLRIDLQNGMKNVFYSDTVNPWGNTSWDPTQQWIFIERDNSYPHIAEDNYYISTTVVNADNPSIVHTFPDQLPHPAGTTPNSFDDGFVGGIAVYDGIVYNSVKNVFYVTRFLPYPDTSVDIWDYQRTAVYDASTFSVLDTLPVPPCWINSTASVSNDGNYLYLEKWEGGYPVAIGKYSLSTKQLIINRNLSDIIVPGIRKGLGNSEKGKYLIGYCYPNPQLSDGKYALYDIDLDTSVVTISFEQESEGSISSNGRFVVIEETPFRPDYKTAPEAFFHTGRISIFDGTSGALLQKLKLPQDGKVLVFDNYPNMLYYYYEKKQTSINIDLTKLATIGTISPTNVLTGSGAFTLSVTGNNFTTNSKVRLNGTNRATTFIADTLLQATIRAGDVDTVTTAYIAVRDSIAPSSHATTDSLALNIVSVPQQSLQPILDCVTQTNDTTYTAWFGYENDDTTSIFVPVGPQNKFTPDPNDRNQPTVFSNGKQDKVFSVVFNGKNLTWKLNGNEIVASKKSPKCN